MDDIRLQRHRRQKPGNSYRMESLNTIDLLIKIGYFVKKKKYSFSLKPSWIYWFKEVSCTDSSLSIRIPCRNWSWWRHNSFTSFGQKTFGRQTFGRLSIDLDRLRIITSSTHSSGNLAEPGSAITNGREPRSCLGRVFNSKLGCIGTLDCKCMVCIQQPLLKLKTWPKACPVS